MEREVLPGDTLREREIGEGKESALLGRKIERKFVTWEKHGESTGLRVLTELKYLGYVIKLY
jgi:hypothetical protein